MVEDRNACDVSEIGDSLITRGCKYQSRGNCRSKWAKQNIGQVELKRKNQAKVGTRLETSSLQQSSFFPDTDRHSNVIS